MTGVRERAAELPSGRLRWIENGAGWPVVMLHAFPLGPEMWRPQLERPPENARYLALDLRDVRGGTMAAYARAVAELLDHLQIDAAAVCGLSMGGYVALALSRARADLIGSLILADTRPDADTPEVREARTRMRAIAANRGAAAIADLQLPRLLGATTHASRPELVDAVRAMIEATPVHAIDAALVAMMGRPDSTADLSHITVPVLLVAGEEDTITPPSVAAAMHERLARSTIVTVPEAGHLSNLEQPDTFSRALEDFLMAHL